MEALKAQVILIRTSLYRELENSEDKVLGEGYISLNEMEAMWNREEFDRYYTKYTDAVGATDDMSCFTREHMPGHRSTSPAQG